jgi:hypothetical protein
MVLVALFLASTGVHAQSLSSAQVPAAATASFQKAQPGISPSWQAGPNGGFEAKFMRDGLAQVYAYDQAGTLQTKKIKTALTNLPVTVQRSLDAGYAGGNVEAAYKVMTRTQEKYYEVQVAHSGNKERLRYNLEGQPIGKTSLAPSTAAVVQPAPSPVLASAVKPAPVVAAKPAPAPAVRPAAPKPAPTTMAMRGESAPAPARNEDEMDDLMDESELDDLLEEEEEEEFDAIEEEEEVDLLEEEDDWEDIDDLH